MLSVDIRIARLQDTLRHLEEDVPLLAMRVRDLPAERQTSATQFAASLIGRVRIELEKLLQERTVFSEDGDPCEPAD